MFTRVVQAQLATTTAGYTSWHVSRLQQQLHDAAAAEPDTASQHAEQATAAAGYSWLKHTAHLR